MGYILIIIMMIIRRNILLLLVQSELLIIVIITQIYNQKNNILFFLFNLINRLIIFYLGNIIKLGIFPFTYIIVLFYTHLKIYEFMMMNIVKLPYLSILHIKLRRIILFMTILYVRFSIYNVYNVISMITIYRVISTVIILRIYYCIRLLSIYLCFIRGFEVVRIYNLIRLPLSLTFYIKVQFFILLNYILIIIKFITNNFNSVSKKVIILLGLNFITI